MILFIYGSSLIIATIIENKKVVEDILQGIKSKPKH
jgi:hypothetical protein